MFRADRRGRITIVEVLMSLFTIGFLAALWPVVQDAIDTSAATLNAGELYMFRLLLPLMLLVLFSVIFVQASAGGGR